ncbi:MAG: VOC family protein [Acidobacteriota bacterium]
MTNQFWMTLPVKNVDASVEFFTKLGFTFDPKYGKSALQVGTKDIVVMLSEVSEFEGFTKSDIADTKEGAEVLFNLRADSHEEVDDWAKRVLEVGGTVYRGPEEKDGWMYGCGFADPDGHRWSMLYMDESKMPKGN